MAVTVSAMPDSCSWDTPAGYRNPTMSLHDIWMTNLGKPLKHGCRQGRMHATTRQAVDGLVGVGVR